jgi:PKD repeat protein
MKTSSRNPQKYSLIISVICFVLLVGFFVQPADAQHWAETLPHDREAKAKLTLYDYQNAFYNYWEPYHVENGYYFVNGKKQKAGGWKQFKRWEWFWESRVDPKTGAFPKTSAIEKFEEFIKQNRGERNVSGNWTVMGPNSSTGGYAGIGRLNCVAFSPNDDDVIYAGAAAGGIWKTTDGGSNWTASGDFNDALGVSDIAVVSTVSDDILYLATGDRDHSDTYSVGVLKSTDGGGTWSTTGLSWTQSQGYLIYRLLLSPVNSNLLYAATNGGVYKTTNAGTSWTQISTHNFKDLEFNPGNSSTIYGSTEWGEVYRSTNSGSSWTQVLSESAGRRTQLAVSDDNNARVYAIMANTSNALYAIYKSTDNGATFTQVFSGSTTNLLDWSCDGSGSGGQGWYDLCIAADPNNADVVYVGGINTWKSNNAGSSWSIINHWSSTCGGQATMVHADKHNLAFQNGSSTLFECNDGGIYTTSDGGSNWTDLTNTMVISQMYRLGVAQTTSDDVVTGLQDNGTKNFEANVWEDVIGGDGMECIVDFTNANTQYGELYYGNIKRTTDHWANYTTISNGISGSGSWVTPYVLDPNDNQTLFVGYSDVWKSTNQGNTWSKISDWDGDYLRSIAVAPSNSLYIYTATYSTIYKTEDGGSSWTDITSNLPVASSSLTYIAVKDDDPNTVWVAFGGFNADGVYQTTNGGSSWTNISGGLPQLPVNCVIQNKLNTSDEELYAGTDVGVYVKVGSANWTAFYDSLPHVVVNELDIYYDTLTPSNSLIRAATFGRGLWESELYSPLLIPVADFVADTLTPSTIDTVRFTDLSSNSPTSWFWDFDPSTITYQNGTDENSQNPIVIFDSAAFYTVSLTATNSEGSDTETKIDYIEVSQAPPDADFVADTLTPSTIDTVRFTDLSANNPTSWQWDFDPTTVTYQNGTDENSQNPIVIFDSAAFYSVTLTATNAGGSDSETKIDYIDVSQAPPEADFEADDLTPSTADTVHFTDLSINKPTSWQWDFDPATITYQDGTDENSQNPVVIFDSPAFYTVTLTATNAGGSDTEIKIDYIEVSDVLNVIASADPDEICLNDSTQLDADASGGSGNYTYSWTSVPVGFVSDEKDPVATPEVTTVYTVEVSDGVDTAYDDVEVTVNDLPEITLGDWPETLCNQQEPPVQLTAEPEGGTYSGNVTEDGIFTPETAPLGWNVITYTYADGNNCENAEQDSIYVDECVGIENLMTEDNINIYPNPNGGKFIIESSMIIQSVKIINQLGEVVFVTTAGKRTIEINADLKKGVYYIRLITENASVITKEVMIY